MRFLFGLNCDARAANLHRITSLRNTRISMVVGESPAAALRFPPTSHLSAPAPPCQVLHLLHISNATPTIQDVGRRRWASSLLGPPADGPACILTDDLSASSAGTQGGTAEPAHRWILPRSHRIPSNCTPTVSVGAGFQSRPHRPCQNRRRHGRAQDALSRSRAADASDGASEEQACCSPCTASSHPNVSAVSAPSGHKLCAAKPKTKM